MTTCILVNQSKLTSFGMKGNLMIFDWVSVSIDYHKYKDTWSVTRKRRVLVISDTEKSFESHETLYNKDYRIYLESEQVELSLTWEARNFIPYIKELRVISPSNIQIRDGYGRVFNTEAITLIEKGTI